MLPISLLSSSIYSLISDPFCLIPSSSSWIVSNVFLSLTCPPFHYLQFLSSLTQYSSLYLLSDYPNNFFAINLSGNYPCYQWTVNVLSNHPRWMFKKNSIEFLIGLQPYLYYVYSGCTLESHNHMFFPECSMITWPYHVIWLTESPPYLYPYSIVCFEVLD